jgi:hypothetical protein
MRMAVATVQVDVTQAWVHLVDVAFLGPRRLESGESVGLAGFLQTTKKPAETAPIGRLILLVKSIELPRIHQW